MHHVTSCKATYVDVDADLFLGCFVGVVLMGLFSGAVSAVLLRATTK